MSRAWLVAALLLVTVTHPAAAQTPPEEISAGLDTDLWAGVQFGTAAELDGVTGSGPVYPHLYAVTVDHAFSRPCGSRGLVLARRRYWRVEEAGAEPRLVASEDVCVPAPPAPASGPGPVRVADLVRRRLPPPRLSIAPRPEHGGLTGLATHLWYDPAGLVAVDHDADPTTPARPGLQVVADAGPWRVRAVAAIVAFRWRIVPVAAGGDLVYTSTRPGSPSEPAARHVPTRAGRYRVTITTEWTGVYRWRHTGTGGEGTGLLDPVRMSTTRPYRVDEVRAVPLPDP